jgi:hypothetical protein
MRADRKPAWIALALLVIAGLACSLSAPTPAAWSQTPTAAARQTGEAALASTATAIAQGLVAARTATSTPVVYTPTPFITNNLNSSGPWLVYPDEGGQALMVANADGGGLTRYKIPTAVAPEDFIRGAAPAGGWLALRTADDPNLTDLSLQLIHLPDGKVTRIAGLLSDELKKQLVSATQGPSEALAAVRDPQALSWSPDGRYLAFIGAEQGISADLYIYELKTGQVKRLTIGPEQAATPTWSPDSRMVVTQEVARFGGGAGWQVNAVWAFDLASEVMTTLYTPPAGSGGEIFLGWTSPYRLVSYSFSPGGSRFLRAIEIENKITERLLYAGPFEEAAFDSASQVAAITQTDFTIGQTGLAPGLYLLNPGSDIPGGLQAGDWTGLRWLPDARVFVASGAQGALLAATNGVTTLLRGEKTPLVAPGGSWTACLGDGNERGQAGLRLYSAGGSRLQTITAAAVMAATWRPGAAGLFYVENDTLYLASFPELKPAAIISGIKPGAGLALGWVNGP